MVWVEIRRPLGFFFWAESLEFQYMLNDVWNVAKVVVPNQALHDLLLLRTVGHICSYVGYFKGLGLGWWIYRYTLGFSD